MSYSSSFPFVFNFWHTFSMISMENTNIFGWRDGASEIIGLEGGEQQSAMLMLCTSATIGTSELTCNVT